LGDAKPLGAAAEPFDFCSIHVKRLVKADSDPAQPRPSLAGRQFFDTNDEPMQDARYLASLVHRQMNHDLVVHEYSGGANE
jgi:hypothetical protein